MLILDYNKQQSICHLFNQWQFCCAHCLQYLLKVRMKGEGIKIKFRVLLTFLSWRWSVWIYYGTIHVCTCTYVHYHNCFLRVPVHSLYLLLGNNRGRPAASKRVGASNTQIREASESTLWMSELTKWMIFSAYCILQGENGLRISIRHTFQNCKADHQDFESGRDKIYSWTDTTRVQRFLSVWASISASKAL